MNIVVLWLYLYLILSSTTITWICKAVRHKSLNGQSSVPTHCCRPAKIDYQIKANIMSFFSCQTKQEYKPSWPRCGRASPWVDPPGNWLDDELAAQWVGQQRLQSFLLEFELLRAWEGNKACENNLNSCQLESKLLIISNNSKNNFTWAVARTDKDSQQRTGFGRSRPFESRLSPFEFPLSSFAPCWPLFPCSKSSSWLPQNIRPSPSWGWRWTNNMGTPS